MHIDRLIKNNIDQVSTNYSTTQPIRKHRTIKYLIHKFFQLFGIVLLKETSLKKINTLLYSIEYNTAFARYFILEREQIDQVYSIVTDDASRLSLDRYLKYRFALPLLYDIKNYNSYTLNTDYLLEIYKREREREREREFPLYKALIKQLLILLYHKHFLPNSICLMKNHS